jgi:hypothetical protein
MKTQILSLSGEVIAESDTLSLVELIVLNKHKLHNANLREVDLHGAHM